MSTTDVPTRAQPGDTPRSYQPRIVVKLREEPALVASLTQSSPTGPLQGPRTLDALRQRFPGAPIERLIQSVTPARLQAMVRDAARAPGAAGRRLPDPQTLYTILVPQGTNPEAAAATARGVAGVERAYVQSPPVRPPVTPGDDPLAATQGYLGAAPRGIDARFAWTIPGGDGKGIGFVDLEQGWVLDHEDLVGAGITATISGLNNVFKEHGTNVLGVVLSQDNTRGCVGIAPLTTGRVVSQWRTAANASTSDAIFSAILAMQSGDVLLLEAQAVLPGSPVLHPVEIDWDVWLAIRIATWLGIIVVEAGANGGIDLDAFRHPTDGFILKPGHADFRESGAIIVGAACAALPHVRRGFSNRGKRVNCFAWGDNVVTTDTDAAGVSKTMYTNSFNGTSSASAIVAGAAVAVQGMVAQKTGSRWDPARMRSVLSDPVNGTPSSAPATDKIGVMPNLREIVRRNTLAPAAAPGGRAPSPATPGRQGPGDFPLPVGDTRVAALFDAGHGGEEETAEEAVYAGGYGGAAVEKDINLNIARSVQAHFGGAAALTREGDYRVPLGQRTGLARETGTPVFVSIHSNTGRTDRTGPEVWVYGGPEGAADPGSRRLAHRISGELSQLEGGPVPVRAGNLALLRPGAHASGTAACLVEAGSLAHPGSAARLRDVRAQDAIGAALARGVSGYLDESGGY